MNQELNKGFIPSEEVINFKPETQPVKPNPLKEGALSLAKMIEDTLKNTPDLNAKVKKTIQAKDEKKDLATKGVYLMEDENDDEDKRYVSEAMKNKKTKEIIDSMSPANKAAYEKRKANKKN